MISKKDRAMSITNRGSDIYYRHRKYNINDNVKMTDRLSSICVYKDDIYKFSACLYYSYYVVLYLLDKDLERKTT